MASNLLAMASNLRAMPPKKNFTVALKALCSLDMICIDGLFLGDFQSQRVWVRWANTGGSSHVVCLL